MANLLRCYRHSGLVMYFSTLPAPSASAPCILAILTHLRVRVKICILTHPPIESGLRMIRRRDTSYGVWKGGDGNKNEGSGGIENAEKW